MACADHWWYMTHMIPINTFTTSTMVSNGVSILEHNIHLAQLFSEETVITLADWYHQAAVTIEGQRPYVTLY